MSKGLLMENENIIRHPKEALIMKYAIEHRSGEIEIILNDLCIADPIRCQVLQETIHDLNDPILWEQLLTYLAYHCWCENAFNIQQFDPPGKDRIDQAIVDVFLRDESDRESAIKVDILLKNLDSSKDKLRYSSAYLLGLRRNPASVPILSEIIEKEDKAWKLRSVKALSNVNNEDCAVPLMKALISDRGEVHREARRALQNLGSSAESVWSKALNHTDGHIRWEAAHGLGQIGDSRAVQTLAEGLLDENYVVRWTTASVLGQIGEKGVQAILNILVRNEVDDDLQRSTFHALNRITSPTLRQKIKPLMIALSESTSCELPSNIAKSLLMKWEECG